MTFIGGRVLFVVLTILAGSVLAFSLPRLAPGDVAVVLAGPSASQEAIEAIRESLGLNRPFLVQYLEWMGGLLRGDLGTSYMTGRPVASLIGPRIAPTLELAVVSTIVVAIVGIGLGVALNSARWRAVRVGLDLATSAMIAVPSFLVALLLILVFGVYTQTLPVSGTVNMSDSLWVGMSYLVLPVVALSATPIGIVARLVNSDMGRVRGEEFVDLAVSKGASPLRVTVRHVLRNSLGAGIVAIGMQFGNVLAGALIIEAIFARDGLGRLAIDSVLNQDYPVLQVLILGAIAIAVITQLLSEVVMAMLDPRIRSAR